MRKMKEKMRKGQPVGFSLHFNFLTGRIELADDNGRDDKQAKSRKPKS